MIRPPIIDRKDAIRRRWAREDFRARARRRANQVGRVAPRAPTPETPAAPESTETLSTHRP